MKKKYILKWKPDEKIAFSRINYVVGGNVPILEEMEGLITIDPLSYNEVGFVKSLFTIVLPV